MRFVRALPAGAAVLDVAAGSGRHARAMANLGLKVTAIDRDEPAMRALAPMARTIVADIESGPWPLADEETFTAIVVTNYLHRPLLPRLVQALSPGGLLVYETFALGNESYGKPSNPDFLLQPDELFKFAASTGLSVLAFEQGFTQAPRPAVVQRLAAAKPPFERENFAL
jgi:SAM-dependent methyltransferase